MKKIPICVYVSLHTYIEITIYICMYTLLIYSYICTAHILYGKSYTYKEIHNTGCTSTHIQTHVQNTKRNGYGLVVCAFLSRRPYVPVPPLPVTQLCHTGGTLVLKHLKACHTKNVCLLPFGLCWEQDRSSYDYPTVSRCRKCNPDLVLLSNLQSIFHFTHGPVTSLNCEFCPTGSPSSKARVQKFGHAFVPPLSFKGWRFWQMHISYLENFCCCTYLWWFFPRMFPWLIFGNDTTSFSVADIMMALCCYRHH